MISESEYFFSCPYCGEEISFLLDLSLENEEQAYTEDCEVCCRPIEIRYTVSDGEVAEFVTDRN